MPGVAFTSEGGLWGSWMFRVEQEPFHDSFERVRTLNAHYDGKNVVLDEPVKLKPNTKVRVIVPEDEESDADLVEACARVSEASFQKVWDNPLDADYDKL